MRTIVNLRAYSFMCYSLLFVFTRTLFLLGETMLFDFQFLASLLFFLDSLILTVNYMDLGFVSTDLGFGLFFFRVCSWKFYGGFSCRFFIEWPQFVC